MSPNTLTGYRMVLITGFRILLVAGLIMSLSGCREKIFSGNVDCSECYTDEPDSAMLYVEVTINDKYREVPLVLYREEFEKELVDYVDTTDIGEYWVWVATDQKYSVRVEYTYHSDTIYVIDATTIKAKRVSEDCDDVCWVVVNDRLDATLRF